MKFGRGGRDLAVHQDDPDDRDHDADEVDAHADGQDRLPDFRRPQEGDEASYDDSKARAHHPESPDGQSPISAVANSRLVFHASEL